MTLVLRRTVAASAVALAAVAAPVVAGAPAQAAEAGPIAVTISGAKAGSSVAAGGTQRLTVELINRGSKPRQVRASVGAVGKAGDPGAARWSSVGWLQFGKAVVMLPAGGSVKRALAVDVPAAAKAGEYAAQVVVVDVAPAAGSKAAPVTAPVVVRVKGALNGAANLGPVTHQLIGSKSTLTFQVRNTGNRVLRPKVLLALKDAAGKPAGSAQIDLKAVYAGTTSTAKLPLAVSLPAGVYSITSTLTDAAAATKASHVTAAVRVGTAGPAAKRAKPPISAAAADDGGISPVLVGGALVVLGLLGALALLLRRRGSSGLGVHRAGRGSPADPDGPAPDGAEPLAPPTAKLVPAGAVGGPESAVHLPTVFAELAAHTPPPPPAPAVDPPTPMLVGNYTVRDILPGG